MFRGLINDAKSAVPFANAAGWTSVQYRVNARGKCTGSCSQKPGPGGANRNSPAASAVINESSSPMQVRRQRPQPPSARL